MATGSQVGQIYITGQLIVKDTHVYNDPCHPSFLRERNLYADMFVECPVCKDPVGLRVGYVDKYVPGFEGKEKYVHYQPCLSAQRMQEIRDTLAKEAADDQRLT